VATVPVGRNPNSVAWAPDGDHFYVTNETDNTVSVIDGATDLVTANLAVGKTPTSISVAPDGRTAWVADLDVGALTRLDLTSP
jgi:YVTN family beta-propeller protein